MKQHTRKFSEVILLANFFDNFFLMKKSDFPYKANDMFSI